MRNILNVTAALSVVSFLLSGCTLSANILSFAQNLELPPTNPLSPTASVTPVEKSDFYNFYIHNFGTPRTSDVFGDPAIAIHSNGRTFLAGDSSRIYMQDLTPTYPVPHQFTNGTVTLPLGFSSITGVYPLDNGKTLVAGNNNSAGPYVLRLHPDGSLDTTFLGQGYIYLSHYFMTEEFEKLEHLHVLPSGQILVQGNIINSVTSAPNAYVIRLHPDGQLDTLWGVQGLLRLEEQAVSSEVLIDGSLILISVDNSSYIVRKIDSAGNYDLTFATQGQFTIPNEATLGQILPLKDGRFILPDSSSSILMYWNSNGTPDLSLNVNGYVDVPIAYESLFALVQQEDSKIVLATFEGSPALMRLHLNGTPDNTFGTNGASPSLNHAEVQNFYMPSNLVIDNDGKITVVGRVTGNDLRINHMAARFNSNGTLDTSFAQNGILLKKSFVGPSEDSLSIHLSQSDGKNILIGKTTSDIGTRISLTRLNANGLPDTSFGTQGKVILSSLNLDFDVHLNAFLQPDHKILLIAALSASENDVALMIRLDSDGSFDSSFGTNGIVTVFDTDFPSNGYVVRLSAHHNGTTYLYAFQAGNSRVIKYNGAIKDTNFGNSGIYTVTFDMITDMIIGPTDNLLFFYRSYDSGSSLWQLKATAITITGEPDTAFAGTGTLDIQTLVNTQVPANLEPTFTDVIVDNDNRILISGNLGWGEKFFLLRINANGSLDTTFATTGIVVSAEQFQNLGNIGIVLNITNKILVYYKQYSGNFEQLQISIFTEAGLAQSSFSFHQGKNNKLPQYRTGTAIFTANCTDNILSVAGTASNSHGDDSIFLQKINLTQMLSE